VAVFHVLRNCFSLPQPPVLCRLCCGRRNRGALADASKVGNLLALNVLSLMPRSTARISITGNEFIYKTMVGVRLTSYILMASPQLSSQHPQQNANLLPVSDTTMEDDNLVQPEETASEEMSLWKRPAAWWHVTHPPSLRPSDYNPG
jgi:hypothetical protein